MQKDFKAYYHVVNTMPPSENQALHAIINKSEYKVFPFFSQRLLEEQKNKAPWTMHAQLRMPKLPKHVKKPRQRPNS